MPPQTQSVPLDPALLAAFRHQGAAIVARERGLSPACRIKLVGIARSLGIGDEQIEDAIRSLTAAEPNAPPNAQAERFRRRLRKDLAATSRTIIGPTIESQILAAAQRKFSLDAAVALQVLTEVATERGLKLISASDAIQSLEAQIDQAAGDSTWLAREAWDRLRSAGCKWGLELEVIDELIDERLAANRAEHLRRSFWTRMTLYGAGGAVVAACVIVAGLMLARKSREEDIARSMSTASAEIVRPRLPAWWDIDLSVEMAHARSGLEGLRGACDLMASSVAGERARGYERLCEQLRVAPNKSELLAAASRIFAGCYALESDDTAATRLRNALLALLPTSEAPLPATPAQWGLAFWAADTALAALNRRGATNERTAALADALSAALGATFDPTAPRLELRRLAAERTALAAYRQLTTAASKDSANVAALYPALAQRAAAALPEAEFLQAEITFLVAALPASSDWKTYERPLVRCVASPDPLPALRLLDALRRTSDPKLAAHLSQLLIVRAGARPKSTDKKDVIAAVRQALGGQSGVTAADRWLNLQEEASAALAAATATSDERELLKQTLALTHLTTLAIALAQGEAGFATFDAGLANPPQLAPASSSADAVLSLSSSGSAKRGPRLTKNQQRDLAQCLDTLDKLGPATQPQREAALRSLTALADETSDISPQQTALLARYLVAEKSAGEQAKALAAIAELRHWKHLRLAVADQFLAAKLPLDQARTIAASLLGHEPDSGYSVAQLRRVLVHGVVEELVSASAEDSDLGALLDNASQALAESYRQRAALWSASPGAAAAGQTAGGSLELALRSLAAQANRRAQADRLPHELKAAQYLGTDDLHYTVALQRLLVELSAQRVATSKPQQAGAARQIAAQSLAASASAGNVLVQLREQEVALLKLWMLYAPDA